VEVSDSSRKWISRLRTNGWHGRHARQGPRSAFDDPDELQSDFKRWPGSSAGPNGGQMYIEGFTAARFLPKVPSAKCASKSEVRFPRSTTSSAMANRKILTKPGTEPISRPGVLFGNHCAFKARTLSELFRLERRRRQSFDPVQGNIDGRLSKKTLPFFSTPRAATLLTSK